MAYDFTRASSQQIAYGDVTVFDNQSKITLNMWMRPDGSSNFDGWLHHHASNVGVQLLHRGNETANLFIAFRNGIDSTWENASVFTVGAWHNLHIIFDGTIATEADRVKAWVNGSEVALLKGGGTAPTQIGNPASQFRLGYNDFSHWDGGLAEVAIWLGVAITDLGTIRQLAGCWSAPSAHATGLRHYLPLRTHPHDVIGGLRGTLTNGPVIQQLPKPIRDREFRRIRGRTAGAAAQNKLLLRLQTEGLFIGSGGMAA